MWRKILAVFLITQPGLTVAAKPARANRDAIPYTLRLPDVDKIELEKFKTDGKFVESIEATKVLEGDEAKAVAALWRRQDYRSGAAICHEPAFGIKFYSKGKLISYASLCWQCNNIVFLTPKLKSKQGFTGDSKRGKELLEVFTRAFPQ
jgi:hypothetical protein